MKTPRLQTPEEKSPSTIFGRISILISLIAIIISFLNLYFSQLRHYSQLSAFVSDLSVFQDNIQEDELAITADRSVILKMALTNSGNAPGSLLKAFIVIPRAPINNECSKTSHIDWEFLSSYFFNTKEFQGQAFNMNPAVVPPLGIVAVEATIDKQHISHRRSEPDYLMCLAFIAMKNSGEVVTTAFPALNLWLTKDGTGHQTDPALQHPLILLK